MNCGDAVVLEVLYRFRIEAPLMRLANMFDFPNERYIKVTVMYRKWFRMQRIIRAQIRRVRRQILTYLGWSGLHAIPGEKGVELNPEIRSRLEAWPQMHVLTWIGAQISDITEAICEIEAFMKYARIQTCFEGDEGRGPKLTPMFWKETFEPYALNWRETIWHALDMDGCLYSYMEKDKVKLKYVREQYFDYLFADVFGTRGAPIERKPYAALAERVTDPVPKWKMDILFRPYLSIPVDVFYQIMGPDVEWEPEEGA